MSYVYLAGPIDDPDGWRKIATDYLSERGLDVFDPAAAWGGGASHSGPSVAKIDFMAVRECSVLLARYSPGSFGTCAEIGYALALDAPVVLWGGSLVGEKGAMLQHPLITKRVELQDALTETASLGGSVAL